MNKFLPNFFIIGAPKAGTTSLSEYLKTHPNIFIPEIKEPHFFNDDFKVRHTYDFDTYKSFFKDVNDNHIAIGEASVFYLYSKTAVPNILEINPSAKFIVMIRNPVEIAYSWHAQAIHSFGENVFNFQKAWKLQKKRKAGKSIPKFNRIVEALFYEDLAKLGTQVDRLLKIVPIEKIHFVIFDDFKNNPQAEYLKVLDFLGLPRIEPDSYNKFNPRKGYKIKFLKVFLEVIPYMKKTFKIRKNFGLGLTKLQKWNTLNVEKQPINSDFEKELQFVFKEDVILLSNILNIDFLKLWNFDK